METVSTTLTWDVYTSEDELSPDDFLLLSHARKSTSGSYAPYSRYHVGAALRLSDGTIVTGSNQENISFPVGLCAERVAFFSAMANHPGQTVSSVAITAQSDDFEVSEPVSPCGMCRQAMLEYEVNAGKPIRVILGGHSGKVIVIEGVSQLLPLAFMEKGLIR
jgi:cytidine deaminase